LNSWIESFQVSRTIFMRSFEPLAMSAYQNVLYESVDSLWVACELLSKFSKPTDNLR
jgi:hypothetical protein